MKKNAPPFFPSMVSQKAANVKGVTMKYLKEFFKSLVFIFGLTEEARKEAVDLGLVDYSGQGRDKYGR